MEKDLKMVFTLDDEEDEVITVPYYVVTYVDDCLRTHIATVKEEWYLRFLEDRYYIKDCKRIGFEILDKEEK
ncbi:MAG: hypothetical protein IJV94_03465 [Bacilli bacterium]|nr:hypothetical protein [Bacilli bacterium]